MIIIYSFEDNISIEKRQYLLFYNMNKSGSAILHFKNPNQTHLMIWQENHLVVACIYKKKFVVI